MVLWLVARFSELTRRHYLVIMVTIVVPVVFPTTIDYFPISTLWVRLVMDVIAILIWLVFVVVVVSKLVERDTGEARRSLADRIDPVAAELKSLQEEHHGSVEELRLQLEDLERRTQTALKDLDVEMPTRTMNVRLTAQSGVPKASIALIPPAGSMWDRICGRFRHVWQKAREVVWGKR